jgi:hypothetical protein
MRTDELERQIFLTHPFGHPLRSYAEDVQEEAELRSYDELAEAKEMAYEEGKRDAEDEDGLRDKIDTLEGELSDARLKVERYNQLRYAILCLTRRKLKKDELLFELNKLYHSATGLEAL